MIACDDLNGNDRCDRDEPVRIRRAAVDGAFKTPGLRNVELTGPYFHNGGLASLRQVVDFYDRGGNFCRFNLDDLDPDIQNLRLTEGQREDLVAFLVALTDSRVRIQSAPFDHPELFVPNGTRQHGAACFPRWHAGGSTECGDDMVRIPEVGRYGDPGRPLGRFLKLDPNDAIYEPPADACFDRRPDIAPMAAPSPESH